MVSILSRAEPLKLGPFIGGLNSVSDPASIQDEELAQCINFELDLDGSLMSRPPIVETANLSGTWTQSIKIIGRASFAGGLNYVIGSNVNGTYAFDGTTWTTIRTNLQSSVALQFQNNVWIVPKPGTKATQAGGKWDGTTFTEDTNIPEGEGAVFLKNRMFVVPGPNATTNSSRIQYTDTITGASFTWTGSNTIDVAPGNGQNLIDIAIYNDQLILFKNDSTYVFAYDVRPADGLLRIINENIGASTTTCVASYENSLFIYHEGCVYELKNYDFVDITTNQVIFEYNSYASSTRLYPVFVCIVGDRLVCRYYNKVYVLGLKTRTWSKWESASRELQDFGPFVEMPSALLSGVAKVYYAGSSVQNDEKVYSITNEYNTSLKESTLSPTTEYSIKCIARTKIYDFDVPFSYKRLMWWGAEVLGKNEVISGLLVPLNVTVTWETLSTYTWQYLNSVSNANWQYPFGQGFGVVNTTSTLSELSRVFLKFLKSARARQMAFEITMTTDGSTLTGPSRLYSLIVFVGKKQIVPKAVN